MRTPFNYNLTNNTFKYSDMHIFFTLYHPPSNYFTIRALYIYIIIGA